MKRNNIKESLTLKFIYLKRYIKLYFNRLNNKKDRKLIKVINKIETLTGYKYTDIQDSVACGTLILIAIKIFFIKFTPLFNLINLIIFSTFSLKINLAKKIRKGIFLFLPKILGAYYLGIPEEGSWKEIEEETKGLFPPLPLEFNNGEIPKDLFYHKLIRGICYFLIYIRLWIYTETYIYILVRNIIAYMLIWNSFNIINYILSLILIISRFLFLVREKEYKIFKYKFAHYQKDLSEKHELTNIGNTLFRVLKNRTDITASERQIYTLMLNFMEKNMEYLISLNQNNPDLIIKFVARETSLQNVETAIMDLQKYRNNTNQILIDHGLDITKSVPPKIYDTKTSQDVKQMNMLRSRILFKDFSKEKNPTDNE